MEWKSLSILAFLCQLIVTVHRGSVGGTSTSFAEEKKARKASIVMCHPDQTFFCVNFTHYSPCIHLDLSDLVNTSFAMSLEGEFYCGAERCCQVGADSPCTYRCQRPSLEYRNPRIPWNFSRLKKKKRSKKVPLTSEEVDRLNKIVSVKSFIIRQKDLEEWDDNDLDSEDVIRWKPSYKTFCPLRKSSSKSLITETCATILQTTTAKHKTNNIKVTTVTTTSTTKKLTTTTKATTTKKLTTTSKLTTTRKLTTTTTKKPTSKTSRTTTTVKITTKKSVPKWTTQHIAKHTTKKIRSTKRPRRTTTKRKAPRTTKKPKSRQHIRPEKTPLTSLPCNGTYLYKRTFVPGSCEAYFECTLSKKKYNWKIHHCKHNNFFDSGTSQCTKTRNANCDIINHDSQTGRGKRWDERIMQD